jgi:hypothetical protein
MKIKIIFEKPKDITSPGLDGVVILFPFAVRRTGEGALRDQISHHSVAVSISGTLLAMWGFGRVEEKDERLVKTLFEFARQHVIEKIKNGELGKREKVVLLTNTAPHSNPYQLDKIKNPTGAAFTIEVKEKQPKLSKILPPKELQDKLEAPAEIQRSLQTFKEDYPKVDRTAFIMMQFSDTPAHDKIASVIRETLASYGIKALRADDKEYHDDLFANIMTYLYGCSFGVAVFEQIETDDINPNVSLEIGYMYGLLKPVCLLKDKTQKTLSTDLVGKLYKEFDPQDPQGTIPQVLSKWLRDKNLIRSREQETPVPHKYKCEYSGLKDQVEAFYKEAFEFGARPLVMRVSLDHTADIEFSYEGVYPRELFNQLAKKHELNLGLNSK